MKRDGNDARPGKTLSSAVFSPLISETSEPHPERRGV
jgi:hypothetical protein